MPRFVMDSKLYGWDMPAKELLRAKNRLCLLSGLNVVISVVCGVTPTQVTRFGWVGFAASAALVALMLEIIAAVRFRIAQALLDKCSFDSLHQLMIWPAQCHILLMSVALAAGSVSCFQSFGGALDVIVLLGFGVCLASSLLFIRAYRRIPTHHMEAQA